MRGEYKQIVEDAEEFPTRFDYLWIIFARLNEERQFTMMGAPLPITVMQFQAYQSVFDFEIRVWEIDLLRRMDLEWRAINMPKQQKKKE